VRRRSHRCRAPRFEGSGRDTPQHHHGNLNMSTSFPQSGACRDFLRAITRVEVSLSIRSARSLISVSASCTFAAPSLVLNRETSAKSCRPVLRRRGSCTHEPGSGERSWWQSPGLRKRASSLWRRPDGHYSNRCMHAAELEAETVAGSCSLQEAKSAVLGGCSALPGRRVPQRRTTRKSIKPSVME
jgi:hypothetical protein